MTRSNTVLEQLRPGAASQQCRAEELALKFIIEGLSGYQIAESTTTE